MQSPNYYLRNPKAFGLSALRYLRWLPDAMYLKLLYRVHMGVRLDLKNPKTFQEKIQWLKLYNRHAEQTMMVDKYAVKNYVADKIGPEYIIPTLGVWDSFDEIDFNKLPQKFVLKTTHGGGSGGVIVCKDKALLNLDDARKKLNESLKQDIYRSFREWPYKNVPRRIIAEKFIEIPDADDLTDYKVFCFNGEPKYIQVIKDRNTKETIDFFDTDWTHQEFIGLNPHVANSISPIPRPQNLEEMLHAARILAKDTTFVRVDLYQTDRGIYFGELTFYPASGLGNFTPQNWNLTLGNMIELADSQHIVGGKFLIYTQLDIALKITDEVFDYKFFCFSGEPKFFKVDFDRFTEHHANYYDMQWHILPFGEIGLDPKQDKQLLPPPNFHKMIDIAKTLSQGHKFLRVDLYNIIGKIYFGELTFFPASGMGPFSTAEWDRAIGDMIKL